MKTSILEKQACVIVALLTLYVNATEYTFQGAGGDLAIPANWGATSLTSSDVGTIASGGTYTLSQDLTLSQLKVDTADWCDFDFTSGNHTIFLSLANHPLQVCWATRKVRLKGGIWDFGGVNFRGQYNDGQFYLQNGAVITNVAEFSNAYYTAPRNKLDLSGASVIYCNSFCMAGKNTSYSTLNITSGSKIVTGLVYTDINSDSPGMKANNTLAIAGSGSEISSSDVMFGWKNSCIKLTISNGGAWHATGEFRYGNERNASSNSIAVADGEFTVGGIFRTNESSLDNVFAATNSTISLGSISNRGTRTVFDFRNCTVTVGAFYPFMRAGSRVRFSGEDSDLTLADFVWKKGPFWTNAAGANPGSRLEIDDNATLAVGLGGNTQWMRDSSNCTFIVSNGAKFIAPAGGLSIGNDEALPYCHDNTIQVCSGGLLEIGGSGYGLRLHCTNNTVLVSNGTIRAYTVMIGYSSSGPDASGCRLTLQGATPRVEQTDAFWLRNDSVLRFELPEYGYAEGYAPIVAKTIVFNPTARIEIDYEAYLAAGGGTLTLASFANAPADNRGVSFEQWVAAQNAALNLPKGCKLMYMNDGGVYKIVFRAGNPGGMIISFR